MKNIIICDRCGKQACMWLTYQVPPFEYYDVPEGWGSLVDAKKHPLKELCPDCLEIINDIIAQVQVRKFLDDPEHN